MQKKDINKIRKILLSEFKKYNGNKLIKLSDIFIAEDIIKEILFEKVYDKEGNFISYKLLSLINDGFINEVITKVDFSDIDFSNVDLRHGILNIYHNTKLNTNKIYANSLEGTYIENVTFIGNLDNIDIRGTKFIKTNNAKLNLDNMKIKSLEKTNCHSLELEGNLTADINTKGTKFNKNRHQSYILKKQYLDMKKENKTFFEKIAYKAKIQNNIQDETNARKLILRIYCKLEDQE